MALRSPATDWVMAAWGPYPFALASASWTTLRRQLSWGWRAQPRIGASPAMQFTAFGAQRVTLDGAIFPHFRGGLRQIDLMKLLADRAEPQVLVDGHGVYYGRFVCDGIEETRSLPMGDGAPRRIDFTMSLSSYGEDVESFGGEAAS